MKLLVFFLLLLFLSLSCRKGLNTDIITESDRTKITQISSPNDFLKEKNSIIIKDTHKIKFFVDLKIHGNYLIGNCYRTGRNVGLIWNINGEFIGQIGRIGKGPGEYTSLSDIVFISENTFYGIDRARKIVNKYKIDGKNIIFIDDIDISKHFEYEEYIDNAFFTDGKFILFIFSGNKDRDQIVILDSEWKLLRKFHKRKHSADAIVPSFALSDNRIYIRSEFNYTKNEFYDSNIYIYDFYGKLLKTLDIKDTKSTGLDIDKSNKILYLTYYNDKNMIISIYDSNGNFYKKIERENTKNLIGISYTSFYDNYIVASRIDSKFIKIALYDYNLNLEGK